MTGRTWRSGVWIGLTTATVVLTVEAVAQPVAAQAAGPDPDLGSGWVTTMADAVRGGALAGTSELGYAVLVGGDEGYWSADGVTWEPVPLPDGVAGRMAIDLAAGELGFVAVLTGGVLAHSGDGRQWTPVAREDLPSSTLPGSGTRSGLFDVAAGSDGFLAIGRDDCTLLVWASSDGTTWSPAEGLPDGCTDMVAVHTGGRWVAVTSPFAVLTSVDGVTWRGADVERPDGPVVRPLRSGTLWTDRTLAAAGDTLVVPVGASSSVRMWTSVDAGLTWEDVVLDGRFGAATELVYVSMTETGRGFVGAVAYEDGRGLGPGAIISSPDGLTWSEDPVDIVLFDVVSNDGTLIGLGPDGIHTRELPGADELAATGTGNASLVLFGVVLLLAGIGLSARTLHVEAPGQRHHPVPLASPRTTTPSRGSARASMGGPEGI